MFSESGAEFCSAVSVLILVAFRFLCPLVAGIEVSASAVSPLLLCLCFERDDLLMTRSCEESTAAAAAADKSTDFFFFSCRAFCLESFNVCSCSSCCCVNPEEVEPKPRP